MALVAYDNSDSSECEDEDNETPPVVLVNNKTESKSSLKLPEPVQLQTATKIDEEPEVGDSENLFKLLPQPSRKKPAVIEEDDEFLHKKEVSNGVKPKAKITVPSLNDFKDVETSAPIAKPRVTNGKKSGLLSMLPQPRNVAKKNQAPVTATKNNLNPKPLINDYSDESDNEEVENDFFSINKPVELPTDVGMALDVEPNTSTNTNTQRPRGIESFFKKEEVKPIELEPDYDSNSIADQSEAGSSYNGYGSENSNSNEVLLDDEAIMKLCGSRGKRKREEIQIVDVNQKDVLADAREMLLKGLMDDTTKRVSASKKKGNEPTSQQRRKHQITYLAYQAKANEAELQNQWANNKMSKRQTQAKYGF
ncbi:unnamed protein product [Arctia plantaginis]|uniref:Proline-rich protein PRCC n=1 Tax=Arctia plantaginis TaxID=874455 RepID=A0A8S1A2X7_ARCPL|nr:unnamed protein product [Arctia plantaginis]